MPNRLFTAPGIAASFGGMVLIGGLEALYGPSLIRLIQRFDAAPGTVGLVISAHFVGGLAGVLASQGFHARIGNRILLGAGYLLLITGSTGFAWAPTLALSIGASAAAGLGFGVLDYGLSHLFAVAFGSGAGRMLNLLHGFFGIGAITAPLVVVLFGPEHYPAYFTGFAALALGTAALGIRGVRPRPTQDPRRPPVPTGTEPVGASRIRVPAWLFAAVAGVFILHVAVGSGIGTWEAAYLALNGVSVQQAAAATAVFWAAMTASRCLLASVMRTVPPAAVVTAACTVMTAGVLTAAVPRYAVLGLALAGFAIGPIFPTALAWAAQLFGSRSRVSGSLIALSMIGGIAFPPLLGTTLAGSGAGAAHFPLALAGLSGATVAACVLIIGATRRHRLSAFRTAVPVNAEWSA